MSRRGMTALGVLLASCSADPAAPPPAAPQPGPWFEEVAQRAGIVFRHDSGHRDRFLFPECVCGGAALFDMDGDGDLDAYLVQSGELLAEPAQRPGNRLFRNRGDGTFEDVTEGSGADDRGYGIGVTSGDYDNDGDADLYVTNVGPDVLLRNDGGGRFTDVTAAAGAGDPGWGVSAAFLDYDADGDLDLYVTNYINWNPESERDCYSYGKADYCEPNGYNAPARDTLYRNNGDGTFSDVSDDAGLSAAFGNGMGVVCGDFDGNGLPDIFVANDQMENQLWLNGGDGTFRDGAALAGVAVDKDGLVKAGMGCDAADIDEDGDLDLLVVNLYAQSDTLFRNEGNYFSDQTDIAGLASVSRPFTRFGAGFADFNNDGRLDIFQANGRVRRLSETWSEDPYAEPNLLLAGAAGGRFLPLPGGGTSPPLVATSRAAAFGDVDNDGRVDVLLASRDGPAHLLHNVAPGAGNWIMFRVLEEHGRDALGASVTLSVSGRRLRRDVRTAYSYGAANDPRVHVGLGDATSAGDVSVRWIDGAIESFGDFPARRIVTLRRGEGSSPPDPASSRQALYAAAEDDSPRRAAARPWAATSGDCPLGDCPPPLLLPLDDAGERQEGDSPHFRRRKWGQSPGCAAIQLQLSIEVVRDAQPGPHLVVDFSQRRDGDAVSDAVALGQAAGVEQAPGRLLRRATQRQPEVGRPPAGLPRRPPVDPSPDYS